MVKFAEFIRKSSQVSEQAVVYYIHWVELLYRNMEANLGELLPDAAVAQFFEEFKKDHEAWQVKQAQHAISMYRYYLDATTNGKCVATSGKKDCYDQQWREKVDRLIKRLRLQHKSYRTEQSYVGWVRRFYLFLKGKDPELLNEDDVRSFMSYWDMLICRRR